MPDDALPTGEHLHLPPPRGAFDAVSAAARGRKRRSAGLFGGAGALALAAVLGGVVALSGGSDAPGKDSLVIADATQTVEASVTPSAVPSPTATPTPTPLPSSPPSPTATPTTRPPTAAVTSSPPATPTPPTETCLPFLGRVVSSTGAPLSGIHAVRSDKTNKESVTTANGWFTGPTDAGFVVLSPSGSAPQTAATRNVRALRLGEMGNGTNPEKPVCAELDADGKAVRKDLVLAPASVLEGRFILGPEVKEVVGAYFGTAWTSVEPWVQPLRAWIHDGGYRIVGLPPKLPVAGKISNMAVQWIDTSGKEHYDNVEIECLPGTQVVDVTLGTQPTPTPTTTPPATAAP